MLFVAGFLGLQSCAESVRVESLTDVEKPGGSSFRGGTVYISADVSGLHNLDKKSAASSNDSLARAVAHFLSPSFSTTRIVGDLARLEPDSTDVMLFLRATGEKYPTPSGGISRGWFRLVVAAVLAEVYDVVAVDASDYRNTVALPVSAVAFAAYNFLSCYTYERANGDYEVAYHLYVLGPDGSLLRKHAFIDSARVFLQADAKPSDVTLDDYIDAAAPGVGTTVARFVISDSSAFTGLGNDMNRIYPDGRDRVLKFKRNVYTVLDDTASSLP